MPTTFPLVSAGERQPKRARPLATSVKAAAKALVWGVESDEGHRPATLAEAAAAGSMRVDTLRRYLHRPDVRAVIADEKKAFLAWATSANAQALTSIRDTSVNDAARVRAVLALQELESPRDGKGISVTVNNQTNVATQIRPGYVVRLPSDLTLASSETLPAGDAERR
jgi:hypothetical protein